MTMKRIALGVVSAALLAGTALPALAQTLTVAVPGNDLATLDPHRASATFDKNVINWMFNGLVRTAPGQFQLDTIEPDIAESWETSEDGLVWTFTLRQDVLCHGDYGPLTASDVVYSLNRAASPETSSYSADYAAFETVEALDDHTVQITLSNPIPTVLGLLVPFNGGAIICEAAGTELGDGFGRNPVGTGPFAFVEYQSQQFVRLAANTEYFRGAPEIDEILFRYVASDSSRDLAFQSGEVDIVNGRFEQSWLDRMAGLPDTTVQVLGPYELHQLHLNMTQPPLDDIRVRQAIAHAIDRDQLVAFRGEMLTRPATSVIPSGYLGHEPQTLLEHDVERARELLAEAGYPDGIDLRTVQTTLPAMLTTMEVVQAQLAEAGIRLNFELVDHPTFHEQIRQDLSQVVYYGASRLPVADIFLTQFFDSDSIVQKPTAVTNFSHCDVADAEIEAARTEIDPERQAELWQEAQRKIVEAICAVPMYEMGQPYAWTNRLEFAVPQEGSLNLSPSINETTRLAD
ncbi:polyamine ABC transporter substrate-binding protein [Arsenicitalea aurantiaca]|uniref:Polyamine ABC transporter substrate-binding protein n=1 Tax=Arsenicitalea aurantiaca TaxID=1783274 RepID=A0A433X7S3_9HYPH|nr:ABC transporter substrate-binding protein [Arsenicitalea aurantiaca]RUT30109.1 polyamine ABC transporter substrate-binding protein [Arsenicitalea aurantiaca]